MNFIRLMFAVYAAFLFLAAPSMAQKPKDTIRIPLFQPMTGIDDYLDPGPEPTFRAKAVLNNLLSYDEDAEKNVGLLARSWRWVNDTTIEFDLKDGVQWHDGQKLDADDVVYTFEWGTNPEVKLRNKRDFDWIAKVEKLGPYKVRLTAKIPTADAEAVLADALYILPKHVHGKYSPNDTLSFGYKPVGSGPFIAIDVDKNKGALLKRYDNYKHGNNAEPAAKVTYLHLVPIPEVGVQIAEYLAGNLDPLVRVTTDQMNDIEKIPGNVAKLVQGGSVSYLALDAPGSSPNKVMKDPRVRKAMFMAMDRREYTLFEATAQRTLNRGVPEAMCYRDTAGCDYSVKQPDFDVAGAKKLLAEAGYPNGFELELGTYTSGVQNHAVIAAGQLAKIGIRAKISKLTIGNFRDAMRDHKIEAFVGGFPLAGIPDVSSVVTSFFDVPESFDHHGDPELKAWAKEANTIMDPIKRKEIGKKMFDAATERFYFMPLGPRPQSVVHRSDIELDLSLYGTIGLVPGKLAWKK